MKKKRRKLLSLLLLAVFLVSTALLLHQQADNSAGEDSYSQARELASAAPKETVPSETAPTQPQVEVPEGPVWVPETVLEDPHMEALSGISLATLRKTNPDVVGWILLPDTGIDYPVVQGEDNAYYLEHTWDNQENSVGAIFLECQQPDMEQFHTILYGHNMRNNSMFAPLREYSSREYYLAHPYVYLVTDSGIFRYEIYASYKADVESDTYSISMQMDHTKQEFIDFTLEKSVIDTRITPRITDRILTLSTCSGLGYTTRWVVHARLPMVEITA